MKNDLPAVLKKAFVVILPLLALLLASCGAQENIEQDPTVLNAQQYQPETVYIGSLLPLSGANASYGALLQAAQETAVDIINQAHDVDWDLAAAEGLSGYGFSRIELVFRDIAEATEDATAAKEQPADDKAGEAKATDDKAATDKAADDKAATDKATADKTDADKTDADKAATDKAAADKADAAKSTTDQADADKAATDKAAADKADAAKSTTDQAADGKAAETTAAEPQKPEAAEKKAGAGAENTATPEEPVTTETAEDASSAPSPAAKSVGELADLGVVAVLGAYESAATAEAACLAAERGLPLVSGSAADAQLTDGRTYDFGGWFQRLAPTVDMQCQLFFAYIKHLNQTTNAGITSIGLAYQDSDYGRELLDSFNRLAAEHGLQVVARIAYQNDEDTLALASLRMMRNQPQAVFHYGSAEEVAYFAAAYVAARFEPQVAFCCSNAFQEPLFSSRVQELGAGYWCGLSAQPGELIASDSEGESVDPSATDVVSGDLELFAYINRLYRERTGVNMDNEALYEFSSVIMLAQAINAAGSTDPQRLYDVLQEASFPAPYLAAGQVMFDPLGQNSLIPAYVSQLTADGLVSVYRQ